MPRIRGEEITLEAYLAANSGYPTQKDIEWAKNGIAA